jgi:hypothetical protein
MKPKNDKIEAGERERNDGMADSIDQKGRMQWGGQKERVGLLAGGRSIL